MTKPDETQEPAVIHEPVSPFASHRRQGPVNPPPAQEGQEWRADPDPSRSFESLVFPPQHLYDALPAVFVPNGSGSSGEALAAYLNAQAAEVRSLHAALEIPVGQLLAIFRPAMVAFGDNEEQAMERIGIEEWQREWYRKAVAALNATKEAGK